MPVDAQSPNTVTATGQIGSTSCQKKSNAQCDLELSKHADVTANFRLQL